ncbi:Reverse transcriptase zinc-binding domain [Sesbania bispinosa]|nr:Reverse transcriptase zinc-binding domain [Sesbania bispinosa]
MNDSIGQWQFDIFGQYLPHWVLREIHGTFPPMDALGPDHISWALTANGEFSTKTTYHLAAHTNFVMQDSIWTIIWSWRGPHRIKCFLWLIVKGGLKTRAMLKYRKNCQHDLCPICSTHSESVLHVLRDC